MSLKTEVAPAGTRIVAGTAMISNGKKEVAYPETASALIRLALENGWGFDDGLPARFSTDDVYVRILIGRERGLSALTGDDCPGMQFHLIWRMALGARSAWYPGEKYVKTSEHTWRPIRTFEIVRSVIVSNPVKLPDVYVSANH